MIIRHKKFLDICFEPDIVYYSTGLIMGTWINMGYVKSWGIDKGSVVLNDFSQWEKCFNPQITCLRYAKWVPL